MPIKHKHKSLASINKKTFFYINFSSIVRQTKKLKITLSMSIFFNSSMYYFNNDFDFVFFI